jgi:hypothetical protein
MIHYRDKVVGVFVRFAQIQILNTRKVQLLIFGNFQSVFLMLFCSANDRFEGHFVTIIIVALFAPHFLLNSP